MKKLSLLTVLILISTPAYAYIDPSIGAMFIQGLIAVLMLIPFYFRKIISYIKGWFSKKESQIDTKDKDSIDD